MKAQGHVTPILVLVVVLVALVSSYAWLSSSGEQGFSATITTGSVMTISITDLDASDTVDKYTGQKGYQLVDNRYVAYDAQSIEAPYNVYLTQSYSVAATADVIV